MANGSKSKVATNQASNLGEGFYIVSNNRTAMSLDDEIALYQFGQGVRSVADLLDHFSQLDEPEKRKRFVHFYCQVAGSSLVESDIEQALTDCTLNATDPIYTYLNLHRLATGSKRVICIPHTANPPEGNLDDPYKVLLHLFRIDYQRRFALERGNSANWRYWDLSNPEIVQGILTRHQALVEEVYTNPSFRSEFVSLAKLWNNRKTLEQARYREPEPTPDRQTHFDFLTYEEMVTVSNKLFDNEYSRSINVLLHSLNNAFSVRYKLDTEEARRLVFDVIERHLRETYHSDLYD